MADGPGKYDDLCSYVREQSKGTITMVVVVDGVRGTGFSVQVYAPSSLELADSLDQQADVLRKVAASMQGDARRMRQRLRGN